MLPTQSNQQCFRSHSVKVCHGTIMVCISSTFIIICLFFEVAKGSELLLRREKQHRRGENKPRNFNAQSLGDWINLASMIECATNCDPWSLKFYGNYCGYGGSGEPIDDVDRCCEQHDACYDQNERLYGCSYIYIFSYTYTYTCYDHYPVCKDTKCRFWTCICDKQFTECLNEAGCPGRRF